ncbi:Uma2 family endonuclease [Dyadobacter sp. Leaf189]|uniref:Uma2 family endonuclease n=1 Tax=Dyadobacter sp. Leaf189 TaxID=1736295 RepID=UPI0006FB665C|nr:Uma2 family endonuclease [Dyadobacter sp. Leaf189]KQS33729.1 restriction endonuclease [Dyadobacter sp. Leaf189]
MKTMEATVFYNPDLTQIINGEEVMSPSPKLSHHRVSRKLLHALTTYVEDNDLGEVFTAPLDTILEEKFNVLQPDILFVAKEQADIMQDWVRGAPAMALEIVSKGSYRIDTVIKKEIYERYGVKEYWIVFPEKALIEVYTLHLGKYLLHGSFSGEQLIQTPVFPDFDSQPKAIFNI